MGKLAGMFGDLTNTQLATPGGPTISSPTPQQVGSTMSQTAQPSMQDPTSGAFSAPPQGPQPTLSKPSFLSAMDTGPGGTPNAMSPSLTKGGKLLAILGSAAKGGLAGWAAGREGNPRSGYGGAAAGFQAASQLPFIQASQKQALQQGQTQQQLEQAQIQNLPFMRQQLQANLGRTQAETAQAQAATRGETEGAASSVMQPDPNNPGQFIHQSIGKFGQPVGEPMPVANPLEIKPHLIPKVGMVNGKPVAANYNKITGKYEDVDGTPMANFTPYEGGQVRKTSSSTSTMDLMGNTRTTRTSGPAGSGTGGGGGSSKPSGGAIASAAASGTAAMNPAVASYIQGLTDYSEPPPSPRAKNFVQIMNLAKQADPNYDAKEYPARSALAKEYASTKSGTAGGSALAFNTAISHLGLLHDAANALGNGDVTLLNRVSQLWNKETGSPLPGNFDSVKQMVSGEVAKTTGSLSQGEQEAVKSYFDKSNSPEALTGAITNTVKLLDGKMGALNYQYTSHMGHPPRQPLMSPDAAATRDRLLGGGSGGQQSGMIQFKDSQGNPHSIPAANLEKARQRDPGLQLIQ